MRAPLPRSLWLVAALIATGLPAPAFAQSGSSPFGEASYNSAPEKKKKEEGLSAADNLRIGTGVMCGSLLVICLIIGVAHLIRYMKNNVGKPAAKPARRSRYDDDDDYDDEDDD